VFPILLAYAFNGILLITFFIQRLQTFYSRHFFTFLTFFNYVIVSTFLHLCFYLRASHANEAGIVFNGVCLYVCLCLSVCLYVCVCVYVCHSQKAEQSLIRNNV